MPDPVRALTRLLRWGSSPVAPAQPAGGAGDVFLGADSSIARRVWGVLEPHARSGHALTGEALRAAVLPALRELVAEERGRILEAHRRGAGGLEAAGRHAELMDAVVCQTFRLADAVSPAPRLQSEGCAVLALGGYGRRELNPGSDVDLMVLYPRKVDGYVAAVLDHILYLLWDLGFAVGHSCRSLADATRMMSADLTTRTSMLEARFLAGYPALFGSFQEQMWRAFQGRRADQYIQRKIEEQTQRHAKHGGSVYVQEPNVKEGPGGLRDFHTALWVARARHRVPDVQALLALGVLSPVELAQWLQALDFLLRVRTELHYLQDGKGDVLTLSLQVSVAAGLGFRDEASFGVERFMQQYFVRAGSLRQVSGRVVERCLVRPGSHVEAVMTRLRAREIGDGFTELRHEIHILPAQRDGLRADPIRLLKIFWYRLEMGYELSPDAKEAVRSSLELVDDEFRRSNRALGFFLAILRAPKGVADSLRQMHRLGLLKAYIPEFERIDCLVQYDYYHRYTVDEHTFVLLDYLEALLETTDPRLQEFRRIATELKKPEVLKLAVLLHDIGKGEGSGHTERGAGIAGAVLARMGLGPADRQAVLFLVGQHLTMAHIAERRDLDDERLIIEFARLVGDEDLLNMLYLLTYLDINAVGPQVWTDWKGTLLWELFVKTHTILSRGVPEGEEEQRKAASLRAALVAELGPEFGTEVVRQHLDLMPVRYVLTTSSARVAQHLQLIEQVRRGEPVATRWAAFPMAGYSEVLVCAPGAPGRFAKVVGTLTANGINILSAQLFSRADGVMIRTFQVSDGRGAALADETVWQRFARDLRGVVQDQVSVRDLIKARRKDLLSRPRPTGAEIQTRIEFDNVVSERFTVIDVRAQDRLGLLYVITSTLSDLEVDVTLAKITTEVDQAMDVFYATERDGRKLPEGARMDGIREALVRAIAEGIA
jgi:[protein-PII] uridylyltransferase